MQYNRYIFKFKLPIITDDDVALESEIIALDRPKALEILHNNYDVRSLANNFDLITEQPIELFNKRINGVRLEEVEDFDEI